MFKNLVLIIAYAITQMQPLANVKGRLMYPKEFNHAVTVATDRAPIRSGSPVDRFYFAPDPSEVARIAGMIKNDLKYAPEVYDCDDFSYWFKAELQYRWRKAGHFGPLPIIQVFALIKINDTGEIVAHAFNGIVDSTGHVIWIEPQKPGVLNKARFTFIDIAALWI